METGYTFGKGRDATRRSRWKTERSGAGQVDPARHHALAGLGIGVDDRQPDAVLASLLDGHPCLLITVDLFRPADAKIDGVARTDCRSTARSGAGADIDPAVLRIRDLQVGVMARDTTIRPRQLPSRESEAEVAFDLKLQETLTFGTSVVTCTVPLPAKISLNECGTWLHRHGRRLPRRPDSQRARRRE